MQAAPPSALVSQPRRGTAELPAAMMVVSDCTGSVGRGGGAIELQAALIEWQRH